MSIIEQRSFRVTVQDQAEFERLSSAGVWQHGLHMGSRMMAYGGWAFGGGHSNEVTAHTAYADWEHWIAAHDRFAGTPGALHEDEAIRSATEEARRLAAARPALISTSSARIIDVDDEASDSGAFYRRAGAPPAEPPLTFGRGSVVSERTYQLAAAQQGEFLRLSREYVWPWLTAQGARMIAYGHDPLAASDEVITLFAFRSLPEWHRLSRPSAEQAGAEATQAWQQRAALIRSHRGRLLIVDTDFGTPA
jgi:hypothetical protein